MSSGLFREVVLELYSLLAIEPVWIGIDRPGRYRREAQFLRQTARRSAAIGIDIIVLPIEELSSHLIYGGRIDHPRPPARHSGHRLMVSIRRGAAVEQRQAGAHRVVVQVANLRGKPNVQAVRLTQLEIDLALRHQIAERLVNEMGILHADVQRFEERDLPKQRVGPRLLEVLVRALDRAEVPGVIHVPRHRSPSRRRQALYDRPAFILPKGMRASLLAVAALLIGRDEILIAPVPEHRASDLIRARLRREKDGGQSFPVLGCSSRGQHLEFLDPFEAVCDHPAAAMILFVLDAVDEHVVVSAAAAAK